jgi:hypothetical protein
VTPVYKLSANSVKNGRTVYGSMLAGNTVYQPPGDFESIATATVSGATGTNLDFTNIPQTFKHLQLRGYVKLSTSAQINLRVGNGSFDTGSNYSYHFFYWTGASTASNNATTQDKGYIGYYQSANSMWGSFILDIPDYQNTNKYKSMMSQQTSVHSGDGILMLNSSNWRSTSAINQIRVYSADGVDFVQNSTVALYGIGG